MTSPLQTNLDCDKTNPSAIDAIQFAIHTKNHGKDLHLELATIHSIHKPTIG
jgi:hypothetical protein